MTTSEIPQRIYIPKPYASGTNAAYTPVSENDNATDLPSFNLGFPSAFEHPGSGNGKYCTRGMINAIGRLATQNDFARACGGIVTFDPKLAVQIGGYARGAILEFLNGMEYNRVISLVDGNKVDFTGGTADAAYISAGVVNGSVDGVNWAYCGSQFSASNILCKIGSIGATPRNSHIPIGGFCAPRSGIPYFEGNYSFVDVEFPEGQTITGTPQLQMYLFEGTTNPSSLDGVSISGSTPTGVTKTLIYDTFGNTAGGAVLKAVTKGKYYSLWASISFGGLDSKDFALCIS